MKPIKLPERVEVVSIGLDRFAAAVRDQGAPAAVVDWRIPADGDRAAVAAIAFADQAELAALNAIVHPAIGAEMAARRRAASASGAEVVVLDVPLLVRPDGSLVPEIAEDVAGVVVVDADEEVAIGRLVEQRGLSEADARARMARQASRESRLAAANFVIDNSGTRPQLEAQIESCWTWIRSLSPPAFA